MYFYGVDSGSSLPAGRQVRNDSKDPSPPKADQDDWENEIASPALCAKGWDRNDMIDPSRRSG